MGKKHQDGAKSGRQDQQPGRHRGPETGNGYTASTGHGKPDEVAVSRPESAKTGRHRVFEFLWTRRR